MRMSSRLCLALITALHVSACSGGGLFDGPLFTPDAPDEFAVLSTRPLTMPPEFSLPVPGTGTKAERVRIAAEQVDTSLLHGESARDRTASSDDESVSSGEAALLKTLSAHHDDLPELRVEDEVTARPKTQPYLLERFFDADGKDSVSVIDPAAERARIQAAKEDGEVVTGEGAAEMKDGGEGLLQRWFGG